MNVRKTDEFIADVERQFEWYLRKAGSEVAGRYLDAVQAACGLVGQHPHLGPLGGFAHSRLKQWRFFLVFRPFQKHILFYDILAGEVVFRRTMHEHRNLPRRLLEPHDAR